MLGLGHRGQHQRELLTRRTARAPIAPDATLLPGVGFPGPGPHSRQTRPRERPRNRASLDGPCRRARRRRGGGTRAEPGGALPPARRGRRGARAAPGGRTGPIRDIDLYWHLLVGQDILARNPGHRGRPRLVLRPRARHLGEHAVAGRGAVRPRSRRGAASRRCRLVPHAHDHRRAGRARRGDAVAASGARRRLDLRARPGSACRSPSQDRSQQLTFLLAPLVGWWAERLWREGTPPALVARAPARRGVGELPRRLGHPAARARPRGRRARSSTTAGATRGLRRTRCWRPEPSPPPASRRPGIDNALAARRFSSSTTLIIEWQPVTLWDWTAVPLVGMLLHRRTDRLGARASAPSARRARARAADSSPSRRSPGATSRPRCSCSRRSSPARSPARSGETGPHPAERDRADARCGAASASSAPSLVAARRALARRTPVVDPSVPQRSHRADRGDDQRLSACSTPTTSSGPLLWFGGGPPARDASASTGGPTATAATTLDALQTGLIAARPGWESAVRPARTRRARSCGRDEALSGVLVAQRGWVEVGREGDYVLLRAPGRAGLVPARVTGRSRPGRPSTRPAPGGRATAARRRRAREPRRARPRCARARSGACRTTGAAAAAAAAGRGW